ncbi:P-loop containing nucleoside triphosphate hydrolase protein [Aaosphaeria arxii CBS 175.79]|uniref:ATP-dependent RNA helicase ROK1 n=1 Tax=Aaosphaeria arxii CBS 175.79 TaxID=1450172 RepID=A0A6A5XWF6_9PLEO|nr:P-loop containing nucleoside triphosphate hydrolase protein [Aaosphaeria arxii CBS 175.79]KAF2017665.1 P-loop containing nucleoside triphosphate hydrolase protein [Aaosphaeria arxii CBS 175.79]
MDIFKILSRSSKATQPSATQKLPSSGAVANPQLFGHTEPRTTQQQSKKSRKRKRLHNSETPVDISLTADVDFFGGAFSGGAGKPSEDTATLQKLSDSRSVDEPSKENLGQQEEDIYNEDESKRILRSHKLKIAVLEDFAPPIEEEHGKESSKSKKRKKNKEKPQKPQKTGKTQFYPQPLTSFSQLRSRYTIARRLAENIAEQGYKLPTEVQLGALPLLLNDKNTSTEQESEQGRTRPLDVTKGIDLLTVAPTGSGKTIAFLIPIINSLLSQGETEHEPSDGPRALVLAPTKELASQIVNEARKLSKGTRVKATLMKKGVEVVERPINNPKETADLSEGSDEEGAESESDVEKAEAVVTQPKAKTRRAERVKAAILVATPLALLNALKQQDGSTAELLNVRTLVLDEADVLLDPLFREQVLAIWNACSHPSLRVGLWSATMGSNIESLVVETLNKRWKNIITKHPQHPRSPLIRLVVGLKDTAIPNITHKLVYAATEQGKLLGLRQLLHPTATPSTEAGSSLRPPFLVFTQTIPRAIALHSELRYDIPPEAGGSSRIAVLHADLSSSARESIMTRFRRGEVWVLITTDLLARGVDFRGLNGVVNYDVPNSAAAYVHRVGRTGRAGREGGIAVTYYTQEDIPYVKNVANVIRASEALRGKGEGEATIQQWLLDALPTPSKRDKQQLKKRGIEARRAVKDSKGRGSMRISTKSGYERRAINNLRGAKEASKRREQLQQIEPAAAGSESEFDGFGDDQA